MDDSRQDLQELIVLKSNLEIALEKDDKDEIKKLYNRFKSLYEKITCKKFEDNIEPEKLAQIESVITGVMPDKTVALDEECDVLDL